MSENNSLALVREAFSQGASKAERQLLIIGKEGGDEALALVTKDLSPGEILLLALEGDSTKSSVVQAFASPEQFAEAFSFFGGQYGDRGTSELSRDLVDFLYPFLFEGEHKRRVEMVNALLKHRLGLRTICCLGLGEPGFLEFFAESFEAVQVPHGSWQEILLFIKEVSPETFQKARKWVSETFPEGRGLSKSHDYLEKFLKDLIAEAKTKVGGDDKTDTVKKTFADL
jgi:hypothetical protein